MNNVSFCTLCWDASTKYSHKYLCGFAALCFLSFLFLLSIREDILSIKSRNTLLLNIGRVSLINFVTINLLGGFSWLFLSIKVKHSKELTRNMPISTNLWRAQMGTVGIIIAKLCFINTWSSITKAKFQNSFEPSFFFLIKFLSFLLILSNDVES